jgi:outer membrane lipoprotein LolB
MNELQFTRSWPNNRVRVGRAALACVYCVAASMAISACAYTSRVTEAPARDAVELNDWQASGRIAVSGASSGGSGSFTWVQRGNQSKVQMRGPVGIGSLRLMLADQSLQVETSDGQTLSAEAARLELANRLGAEVPTQDLRYWMVGIAAPGEHQWTTGVDTATLVQQDWRIDYQRYGVTSGVRLPLKLVAINGPAKVRILIDRWIVGR